jgi:hypothetical protein
MNAPSTDAAMNAPSTDAAMNAPSTDAARKEAGAAEIECGDETCSVSLRKASE